MAAGALPIALALAGTVLVIAIAVLSARHYDHEGARYAEGRQSAGSTHHFRYLYRYLQVTSIGASIASLWVSWPALLVLYREPLLTVFGLVAAGLFGAYFVTAKRTLGAQYSPCFDAYLPGELVCEGPYARVRHPIYTANIGLLGALFVATGSLWLAVNCAVLAVYYWQAARREEGELLEALPSYRDYVSRTGRFVPRVALRAEGGGE